MVVRVGLCDVFDGVDGQGHRLTVHWREDHLLLHVHVQLVRLHAARVLRGGLGGK